MLICGGTIHTMTARGSIVGDIYVKNGRIAAMGEKLEKPDDNCILDARGLTVIPGLIDAQIQNGPEVNERLLTLDQAAGVTVGLLWPEEEGQCCILTTDEAKTCSIFVIEPSLYSDARLHDRFLSMAYEGLRPACRIRSREDCRRVLQVVHSTRVKAILLLLTDCEELSEAIAISACPVIIGVCSRTGTPWAMAVRLNELKVSVSVSCSYPNAKLRHLPLCAALCVREGLPREEALHMVTTAPAALLGLERGGRIEMESRADFGIYDGDPLLLATNHVMTISGGKICY